MFCETNKSVTDAIRFADVGVARSVPTPVPSPETPVEIGSPVQLVRVPLDGVPKIGVVSVGLVSVLFVSVCEPVSVTKAEGIVIVAAERFIVPPVAVPSSVP
jgi:hypothetical protein